MKKAMKKILALVLVLMMTMPLIAVSVGASAPTTAYPTYADATDGALLYTANFNGDSRWAPSSETAETNAGWEWTNSSNMSATVDPENSGKATIKLTTQNNAAWGADITDLPLGTGYSYTVKFTIEHVDSSKPLGLLIDGHYGAYIYSGKARLQRNGSKLSGHDYINYTAASTAQEYAIEVNGDNSTFALYIKNSEGTWVKHDNGAPTEDPSVFSRDHLGLYFYSYHVTEATVSNVNVYKGISLIETENQQTPPAGGGTDQPGQDGGSTDDGATEPSEPIDSTLYDAANEGDILYTANFNGDSYWTPSAQNASQNAGWGDGNWPCDNITVTPDATDPSKATIVLSSAANAAWGDDIEGLPLGADYKYTIKFTVISTNGTKQGIGIFPDGQTGGYFHSTQARIQKGGGKVNDYVSFSGDRTAQDYAIEVDGYSIAIYAKIGDVWTLIDSVEDYYYDTETNEATFFNDNLCLYFYAYNAIDITVGDVNVYKGVSVLENKGELSPDDPDDSGNNDSGSSSTPKPENKPPVLVEDETEEESEIVEEKKGCGSSIGLSGVVLLVASAVGISKISFRRKEDE